MPALQQDYNEWTLISSNAMKSIASYLPHVSEAVCASDRMVRAVAELNGPVHYMKFGRSKIREHPMQFQYNDDLEDYPECMVDAQDERKVELVTWWLQTVGVRSLNLEGTENMNPAEEQRVVSTLLRDSSLTTTGKKIPSVLEAIAFNRKSLLHKEGDMWGMLLHCRRLRKLQVRHRPFQSLDGIETLGALEVLRISCFQLECLEPLAACPHLKELCLYNCSTLLSLRGLEELHSLTQLLIERLPMRELPQLSTYAHLQVLELHSCHALASLDSLERMVLLRHLKVLRSEITDTKFLRNRTRLERLHLCACSELRSLEGLERLTLLVDVDLSATKIWNLKPLRGCVLVKRLNLDNCR